MTLTVDGADKKGQDLSRFPLLGRFVQGAYVGHDRRAGIPSPRSVSRLARARNYDERT